MSKILKNVLKNVLKHRGVRIRIIIFFLILIYLPILLNIYYIYYRTLEVVKTEKVEASNQVLEKAKESFKLSIGDISREVSNFANNLGTGASIAKYHTLDPKYRVNIDNYLYNKVKKVVENNYYIDDAFCLTKDGRIYSARDIIQVNMNKFLNSSIYDKVASSVNDEIWVTTEKSKFTNEEAQEKSLIFVHKIHHIIPENMNSFVPEESKYFVENEENKENGQRVVGYIVAHINKDKIMSLYNKSNGTEDGEIVTYDKSYSPISYKPKIKIPLEVIMKANNLKDEIITEEPIIGKEKYIVNISTVEDLDWYIASIVPMDSLTKATKEGLKNTLWLFGLISIIVSILIIISSFVLSKVIAEKEMVDYRLNLSKDVNDKLRTYKHDFMNHLQIIRALLEMGHPDRAEEYLINVVREGKSIKQNYETGIPEIEATICAIINEAKEEDIEVIVDTIEIDKDLPIELYDLIKAITNLIKNAMQALIYSDEKNKMLKIRIDYSIGNYIFEIINNTPIVPEEIRGKIFEKGFTTKKNKGKGLGLFIVKKIVKKYNGDLDLIVDDEGNHFIMRIPDTYNNLNKIDK